MPIWLFICLTTISLQAQVTDPVLREKIRHRQDSLHQMQMERDQALLAEPFKGITAIGQVQEGLFKLGTTGVSTEPVRQAALEFLATLDEQQRAGTNYPIDDEEWQRWMNTALYVRQGVGFYEMTDKQRDAAFKLMKESLSAKGLTLSRNIMRLNHTLAEISDNYEVYGEWVYWITIMGQPSETEPWGWQLDGHHLNINYFVLGDQVVMTPFFVGSEPVIAESGKYKGITILQEEQNAGLKMLRALHKKQKKQAVLEVSKTENLMLAGAFKDNLVLDYAGVPASSFSKKQKKQLLALIKLYVENMDKGHGKVRMEEVAQHLEETWFAWIGGDKDNSVYYYRIHSPVILIEFDHQKPFVTRELYGSAPHRQHIHVIVRTPNGNDYGKDLLRLHLEQHQH
ncbi:MAG: DUF3500 domain-containing protein [Saprospiraceae bacterium]|nr:DUF3500 domain-containing protein [Saprospiraceae bacterium]